MSYDLRLMTHEDLELALGWARDEGWNPGLDDAVVFREADPSGFLMGWLDGEPVSSISVVKYGETFAFLGLYIVRSEHRGKGLGKRLWDAGIASAGTRTIGLDGVVAQQDNYRRSGFEFAYRSKRWGQRAERLSARHPEIRAIGHRDMRTLLDFDRTHFPTDRAKFSEAWFRQSPTRWTEAYYEGTRPRGIGTIRRCVEGWKVGPLFTASPTIAGALLQSLAVRAGTDTLFVDVPEPNAAAVALVADLGFAPAFETARMYRGAGPTVPLDRIFGTTTLELG